jgi:hypothetical protein
MIFASDKMVDSKRRLPLKNGCHSGIDALL